MKRWGVVCHGSEASKYIVMYYCMEHMGKSLPEDLAKSEGGCAGKWSVNQHDFPLI